MNKPYKKIIENGKVVNPITKENPYVSVFKSRSQRRRKQTRFIGNNKAVHITITDTKPPVKLKRIVQTTKDTIILKDGEYIVKKAKRIERYQ